MSSKKVGNQEKVIYIAGHTGLVGSALVKHFTGRQNTRLLLAARSELDLTRQEAVENFLLQTRPDVIIVSAGRVGGIQANSKYPAEFIYQNLAIEANLIHGSWKAGVKKLINFGSSCMYPKECSQPMSVDTLMTGKLEPTNEPYAISKFAGMSLCTSYNRQYGTHFINVIPSNLYGPCDTFDLERCHVIAAMIQKFHDAKLSGAKEVVLWGTGNVTRDFLFIDDFADACEILLKKYEDSKPINVGAQAPCTIFELATQTAAIVGFGGNLNWDRSKPDGASERLLAAPEIQQLGWIPKVDLKTGLKQTYDWFLENSNQQKRREAKCASL